MLAQAGEGEEGGEGGGNKNITIIDQSKSQGGG
jgi:hypothetical protein